MGEFVNESRRNSTPFASSSERGCRHTSALARKLDRGRALRSTARTAEPSPDRLPSPALFVGLTISEEGCTYPGGRPGCRRTQLCLARCFSCTVYLADVVSCGSCRFL